MNVSVFRDLERLKNNVFQAVTLGTYLFTFKCKNVFTFKIKNVITLFFVG